MRPAHAVQPRAQPAVARSSVGGLLNNRRPVSSTPIPPSLQAKMAAVSVPSPHRSPSRRIRLGASLTFSFVPPARSKRSAISRTESHGQHNGRNREHVNRRPTRTTPQLARARVVARALTAWPVNGRTRSPAYEGQRTKAQPSRCPGWPSSASDRRGSAGCGSWCRETGTGRRAAAATSAEHLRDTLLKLQQDCVRR